MFEPRDKCLTSDNSSEIALICMPWASIAQPSLALGLIKAQLAEAGIASDAFYFNLELADLIGLDLYDATKNRNVMASEWVFAEGLPKEEPSEDYLAYLAERGTSSEEIDIWRLIRGEAEAFFLRCLEVVDWNRYKVAAFTTSMMQTVASLNFARRLKSEYPHIKIVLGGANCEGIMGESLHRLFPHVDVVLRGEADDIVTDLFQRLIDDASLEGIPGLCYREGSQSIVAQPGRLVFNIEKNPTPAFGDYFEQVARKPYNDKIQKLVMFESSRGCWWGARSHCKFCALNGTGMQFRAKSVGRIIQELSDLRKRHGISQFAAADNILDEHIVTELANALEIELPDVRVFYDVRATLTREELEAMARGGIDELEAGLENLTTGVLKRMGKGATGINNVRFLRRCLEFGIEPLWNYLFGFPKERLEDYQQAASQIVPWLYHLPAPDVAFPLSLQRFAPYYEKAEENGVAITGPVDDYKFIYGLPDEDLENLAYYFKFDYADKYDPAETGSFVTQMVSEWQTAHSKGAQLVVKRVGDTMSVHDSRQGDRKEYRFGREAATLYRLCESPKRRAALFKSYRRYDPASYLRSARQLPGLIDQMVALGLFYQEGDRLLAIAAPDAPNFWLEAESEVVRAPAPALATQ